MSANTPDASRPSTSNSPKSTNVPKAPDDLAGTDDALDTDALASGRTATTHTNKRLATKKVAKSTRKCSRRAEKPTMTVEEGIAKGLPSKRKLPCQADTVKVELPAAC